MALVETGTFGGDMGAFGLFKAKDNNLRTGLSGPGLVMTQGIALQWCLTG